MSSSNNSKPSPPQQSALSAAAARLSSLASHLTAASPAHPHPHPYTAFDALPRVPSQPQGCAWGLWGASDELGTLNLLTPERVRAARSEIQTGESAQLDWPLHNVQFPGFGRKPFEQKVLDLASLGFKALDDEVYVNTQSGSQWDSLKHPTGMYYNGVSHETALKTTTNGIHKWCERGGIVGRGVLVDWVRWYEHKHGNPPSPVTRHEIPVSELEETLKYQGTTTRPGDIMLIRSGYVRWHNNATPADRKKGTQDASLAIGVQSNEATVRWLYDRHFAAVAGDTVAFEAWPPPLESGWCLHEWLLVQWGTPIGEMWDLEKLSDMCERERRWSFFLTSAPLHIQGGVGSPPGAIAIF
ncbi:Putative cyclase [Macrophomina phaseolina MS6]|uniref:Putative cyclase n=1 Tax=Macrophomina phaseolina (strain MS6) TaxID=1126212 RepID=K2SBW2_MACPH|nr:Putative cyclase [Macrophomina phaseolina MS6]